MLKDFLAQAKLHYKTTIAGLIAASFAALAVTPNLDSMTPGQIVFAYGSCLFVAVKGMLAADAQPAAPTPPSA